MARYLFSVVGHGYQEKLTRKHCVAGMEARVGPSNSPDAGGGLFTVEAYFRFRQRWEPIGYISMPLPEALAARLDAEGSLAASIVQVSPGRGGDQQVSVAVPAPVVGGQSRYSEHLTTSLQRTNTVA